MKTKLMIAFLMAGCLAAPLSADNASVEEVARLAADSSKTIDQVCQAVYEAAQADPQSADKLLSAVIEAREGTISDDELYKVLQAVMAAVPEVAENFQREVRRYLGRGSQEGYAQTSFSALTARVVEIVFQNNNFLQSAPSGMYPPANSSSTEEVIAPPVVSPGN